MELEYHWSATPNGYSHTLLCRSKDAQFDRWDSVATLYRGDNTHPSAGPWYVTFNWRMEALLSPRAHIFRQRWDDVDKAKKAVERKARGMVGVLQIQGNWP
jgi:hypothetical protein